MSPGFSDRYLLQPEQFSHEIDQYHKYIRAMISIADPESNADSFAEDIVEFSKSLAKVRMHNYIPIEDFRMIAI